MLCVIFEKLCCYCQKVIFLSKIIIYVEIYYFVKTAFFHSSLNLYSLISEVSHSTRKDKHIPLQTNEIGSRISWIKTTNPIARRRAMGDGRREAVIKISYCTQTGNICYATLSANTRMKLSEHPIPIPPNLIGCRTKPIDYSDILYSL